MKSFEGDRLSASGQIDQLPSPLDERSSEMRTIRAVSHLQSCGDLDPSGPGSRRTGDLFQHNAAGLRVFPTYGQITQRHDAHQLFGTGKNRKAPDLFLRHDL